MKNTIFILLTAILIVGCKPEKDFVGRWKVGLEVYDFRENGTLIITDREREKTIEDTLSRIFNDTKEHLISYLDPENLKHFESLSTEKRKEVFKDAEELRNMVIMTTFRENKNIIHSGISTTALLFELKYKITIPRKGADIIKQTKEIFASYQFSGDGLTSKWEIRKGKLIIIDYHVWDDKALKHANLGTKTFDYTFTSDKRDLVLSDGVSPQVSLKREQ
jgi:hypothetical protein